jgi:hypothetical protein
MGHKQERQAELMKLAHDLNHLKQIQAATFGDIDLKQ